MNRQKCSASFLLLDDLEHCLGGRSLFKRLAQVGFLQQLGDSGHSMQVLLKFFLRNQKKHDETDGLAVQGIKRDPVFRPSQCDDQLRNQIRRSVRNADAEPDAGAHGLLAFPHRAADGVKVFRLDCAGLRQPSEKFVNRLPTIYRPQTAATNARLQPCNARSSRTDGKKRSRVRFRLSLAAPLRRTASLMPLRRPPAAFRRQRQTET
jgi:hypothetical protein